MSETLLKNAVDKMKVKKNPVQDEQEKVNPKEFVMRRWSLHSNAFRAGSFDILQTKGFVAVDRLIEPPQVILVGLGEDNRVRAYQGDLPSDKTATLNFNDLAKQILNQTIPVKVMDVSQALITIGLTGDRTPLVERSVQRFSDALGDRRLSARLPLAQLLAAESKRFDDAGLKDIKNRFDLKALHVLRAVDSFEWKDYTFYSDPKLGEVRCQAASLYPLLATKMNSYPSVRRAIDRSEPLVDVLQNMLGMDQAGKPQFSKAVIRRLQNLEWSSGGIPTDKLVRALSAFRQVDNPREDISPDWFPKDHDEWNSFCDITDTIGSTLHDNCGLGYGTLYSGCGGKWSEFKNRIARSYTDTRPPEGTLAEDEEYFKKAIDWKSLEKLPRDKIEAASLKIAEEIKDLPARIDPKDVSDWICRLYCPDISRAAIRIACIDAEDMLDAFAKKIILPLAANKSNLEDPFLSQIHFSEARASAAKILFGGKAANTIFENSRHFHSQYEQIMAAGAQQETDEKIIKQKKIQQTVATMNALGIDPNFVSPESWAPLTPISQAPNGLFIVPLTNAALLSMEGMHGTNPDGTQGLYHCVGGYSNSCIRHGHHILSVRELVNNGQTFKRLGTMEISAIVHGDKKLRERQFRFKNNSTPGESAKYAMNWFFDQVENGNIPLNYEGIRAHLGTLAVKTDDIMHICGYEWREKNRVYDAMKPWGKYVGKQYKSMDIDQFAEQPEVNDIIDLINPKYKPK